MSNELHIMEWIELAAKKETEQIGCRQQDAVSSMYRSICVSF